MPLRKYYLSLMEGQFKDKSQQELADDTKIDPSTISNFFNYNNELSFFYHLLVIKSLNNYDPQKISNSIKHVVFYFLKDDFKQQSRHSMEYLSSSGELHTLEEIIQIQNKSKK